MVVAVRVAAVHVVVVLGVGAALVVVVSTMTTIMGGREVLHSISFTTSTGTSGEVLFRLAGRERVLLGRVLGLAVGVAALGGGHVVGVVGVGRRVVFFILVVVVVVVGGGGRSWVVVKGRGDVVGLGGAIGHGR